MPQIFLLPGAHPSPQIRIKTAATILAVEQLTPPYLYHLSHISDPAVGDCLQAIALAGNH